ncbi:MAG TPA: 3D domain-containing protein [Solirubrobacteraceae bacterium]|nr:3D domain-containing protein [Solirubrobacteraceae bacterium]
MQDDTHTRWIAGVLLGLMAAAMTVVGLVVAVIAIIVPTSAASCTASVPPPAGGGEWLATSYGPPWEGIEGTGVTATRIDLRPDKQAYIIAVDPKVIALGSYVHVSPNPFGNDAITFQAADTGSAITGKHIDIYDWRGRNDQTAWGSRHVTVTPVAKAGAGNILEATPNTAATESNSETEGEDSGCQGVQGPLPLTAAQSAQVLSDGLAAAPREAPARVQAMVAAGNELTGKPYAWGGAHGPPLSEVQPAYDCSSAVSFVLHAGGVFGGSAQDSGELESYGEPGPGQWVTVYANSQHAFMYVAGLRFDTSFNGTDVGPNQGKSGPRWRVLDHVPNWAQWVVRHPPGL